LPNVGNFLHRKEARQLDILDRAGGYGHAADRRCQPLIAGAMADPQRLISRS
jgi:hypothetical protein